MQVSRSLQRKLLALATALAVVPVVAQQDESRVFFSLSSDKTFAPAETPRVQLWGQGVKSLKFRLYRVNDPVAFFRNLRDDHQFGGRVAPQSRSRSRIERFRRWKLELRANAKRLVKAQFHGDSRNQLRQSLAKTEPAPSNKPAVTDYAELPVLNEQQLVSSWDQPFNPKNRWESVQVPVPTKGKGLYLLEAANGPLFAYTIVSVTDLGIVTKSSPGRLLTRVVNRATGAPSAGVPVIVFANDKQTRYADAKTDKDGFLDTRIPEEKPESALVLARDGADFAAVSMYGGNLGSDPDESVTAYVYTDRPVYRPGHKVHYRAVVRSRVAEGYRVPSKDVRVEIEDSEGKNVHKATPRLSSMGTVSGSLDLPADASLGRYSIQIRVGESFQSGGFEVQEYKKPEYEVRVIPAKRRVLQGDALQAEIDSRYFFGEPVAGASVKYVAHRSRHWSAYWDAGDEEATPDDSPFAEREQVLEQEGKLDANGKLTVTIPTDRAAFDLSYRIEARVTDAAGREIAGAGFAYATVGPYLVNIQPERYVYEPGAMATLKLEARDYDGKPVPNAKFDVDLSNYDWRNKAETAVERVSAVSGPDGQASVKMRVQSGSMRATVRSRVGERTMQDYAHLWVTGGVSWWGRDEEEMKIVADKKSYAAGETARVMIAAGPGVHLWVTAEGQAVYHQSFVTTKEGTVTVDIPVQKTFAPNFHVAAVAMKDHKLLNGSLMVKVPPVEKKLDVQITPSKKEFKPGEPAVYTIEAKDSSGKPVEGEFSLGIVDEAIYSVEPETVKDPLQVFFGREWNRVDTSSSLNYSFHGEAGRRRMQLARIRPFTARAQLKPESLVQPKVRKAFPDTAFWSAAVNTGANGRAEVKLEFPDALTTWRATARGVTLDTKVGAAVNKTIVRKNLMVRLGAPRFFRQGDEIVVPVIAQNYLANEKKVRVSLEAKGLDLGGAAAQDISVPSKGTASVDYRVKVPAGKEAVLLAKALTDEESDALELTIPVIPFGVKMSVSKGGAMTDNSEASAEIDFPADADPSTRSIDITAAPSVAGAMFDALDYLTAFPYGCTEQTMSSFLPNVIVSQAVKSLNLKSRVNAADLAKKTKAGLLRLYDYQHDDGGWGWWKEDDSDYFMTSYVVAGLARARSAGTNVEGERIANAVKWLRASKDRASAPPDRNAYAAYAMALAGNPDKELMDRLYADRGNLSPYALALAGLALHQSKDSRAEQAASELESRAKTTGTLAWWEAERDYLLDISEDASPEATAFAVKLLSQLRPSSPLLPKAALWLVNSRRGGYYWNSTKQTALVIDGLTGYLAMSGELKPDVAFLVYVNDRQVLSRKFTSEEPLAPASLKLTGNELAPGKNRVKVVRSGNGRLYWSATGGYYSTSGRLASRGTHQLNIERQYVRMAPADRGGKIVYDLNALDGPVKQGDLLAVKLSVTGNEWRYLLIEDPIPSGTEIVPRDDLYEFRAKPSWWSYWFTRREYRDDRAAFFQSYFTPGHGDYFYLLKVINPGQFRVSPARVEPMYQPQYFATSDGLKMEVGK